MEALLEPLLKSSQLPKYIEQLSSFWNNEQKRRKAFYEEMDESRKMEFIEGEIIIHSPALMKHTEVVQNITRVFSFFVIEKELGRVSSEKSLVRLTRNDFEPDVNFFGKEKSKKIDDSTLFFPAPDLVVEVLSKSTQKIDRGLKFDDFALHGVDEFWIVDSVKRVVEQYLLEKGKYELNLKTKEGHILCRAIKGLKIPIEAIFSEKESIKFVKELLKK